MSFPFWGDYNEGFLWDALFLGGRQLPGIWRIEGSKERGVDKVKVPDQDGFTLTNKGYSGGTVRAIGQLWDRLQLDEMWSQLNDYDPEFVTQATPYELYHPAAEMLWVNLVYIRKVSVKGPDRGIFTITFDLDQWMPPTKVAPTRNSDKSKGIGNETSGGAQGFDGAETGGKPLSPEDFELGLPSI